jgi:hypothetical protein
MEKRPQVIEYFLALGKEHFAHRTQDHSYNIDRSAIVQWLWLQSVAEGAKLELLEINEIVNNVHAFSNQVCIGNGMTVKELREKISSLPENMPIFYQRIEDEYFDKYNWTAKKAVGEVVKISERDVKYYTDNPSEDIELYEKDGQKFARSYSSYVNAFTGWVTVDKDGQRVFVITAHY